MAMDFTATTSFATTCVSFKAVRMAVLPYFNNTLTFVAGKFAALKLLVSGVTGGATQAHVTAAGRFASPKLLTVQLCPKAANLLTFVPGAYSAFRQIRAAALVLVPATAIQARHVYMFEPYVEGATPSPVLYAFWS